MLSRLVQERFGWETGWLTGPRSAAEGTPLGLDSGEDPVHCSESPAATFVSRGGAGKAAVLVMLLVKYVCMRVCSLG